jgi:lipoyl synthase
MSDTASKTRQVFPPWLRRSLPATGDAAQVRAALCDLSLHTVCQSAECPNQGECWQRGTATFMVLGTICSRNCAFCGVASGAPTPPDPEEPAHIAEAVQRLRLHHVVVTMVTRDDLPDGGAVHCIAVINAIRENCPKVTVEILTSDFSGNMEAITRVARTAPEVFGHNIETVARLHSILRDPRASYERSLDVLCALCAKHYLQRVM